METDNGNMFSCPEFEESLSDYLDDELHQPHHGPFLAHANMCDDCHSLLKDLTKIKNRLSSLKKIAVSESFNAALRSKIFAEGDGEAYEEQADEKASVIFMKARFILPAAAAIVCAALLLPMKNILTGNSVETASTVETQLLANSTPTGAERSDAETNYVIDSVKKDRAETGVFLNEGASSLNEANAGNIMLVSF